MAAPIIYRSRRHVKIGRPSKYTPELAQSIADSIGIGLTHQEAADEHFIPYDTVKEWLSVHTEFSDLVSRAQAVHLKSLLIKLRDGDNRDAQFLLERCFGPRYARPEVSNMINLQMNNNGGGMVFNWDPKRMEAMRAQLDRLGKVDGKPAELNPFPDSTELAEVTLNALPDATSGNNEAV